jgi:hypothetical protein
MREGILVILILQSVLAFAQPRLKVDRSEVLIGDKFSLMLEVPGMNGGPWINSDVIPADTVASIQVLSEVNIANMPNGNGQIARWEVAVYDTGYVRIPPVEVIYGRGDDADTFYSNDVPILVNGVVDSTGLAPLKPIRREPAKFSDYLPYILGLLGVIALFFLVRWWLRRPKKEEMEPVVYEVPRPPHEVALAQLNDLERRELWQKGQIADYHSILSRIVREYLEERYMVAALESTTSEVRTMLKPHLTPDQFEDMMKMMQLEDLIKFAKAEPTLEVHAQHLDFARQFILSTQVDWKNEEEDA